MQEALPPLQRWLILADGLDLVTAAPNTVSAARYPVDGTPNVGGLACKARKRVRLGFLTKVAASAQRIAWRDGQRARMRARYTTSATGPSHMPPNKPANLGPVRTFHDRPCWPFRSSLLWSKALAGMA